MVERNGVGHPMTIQLILKLKINCSIIVCGIRLKTNPAIPQTIFQRGIISANIWTRGAFATSRKSCSLSHYNLHGASARYQRIAFAHFPTTMHRVAATVNGDCSFFHFVLLLHQQAEMVQFRAAEPRQLQTEDCKYSMPQSRSENLRLRLNPQDGGEDGS